MPRYEKSIAGQTAGASLRAKIAPITSVLATCFVLALLSCSGRDLPYTQDTFVMGTRCVITIYGMDEAKASEAAGKAFRELHRIESVMSTWKEDSEISMLNRSGSGQPVKISEELFGIIEEAFRYSELTGGAFDITARPIVRLWGFQDGGEPALPSEEDIRQALEKVGYEKVSLDRSRLSVTMPEGMELDLAGIGKGYGVDRSIEILRSEGVTDALVNLSGNMYGIGLPEGKDSWTIGIREPHGGEGIVGKLKLGEEGVATSGNYENFVTIGGKNYGHIVDPRTGRTVDHILSVTVIAPTALAADALSTGLFVLGAEEGKIAVESIPGVRAVFASEADVYEFAGEFGNTISFE